MPLRCQAFFRPLCFFAVHTKTIDFRFQEYRLWFAFSKTSVFISVDEKKKKISVDGAFVEGKRFCCVIIKKAQWRIRFISQRNNEGTTMYYIAGHLITLEICTREFLSIARHIVLCLFYISFKIKHFVTIPLPVYKIRSVAKIRIWLART